MNTTNGKIAEQSRQKFVSALLLVMKRYDYKEITITQLAQEAKLSRKTFYRLFPDKEAVLMLYFDEIFSEFLAKIEAQNIHRYWKVMQVYFDFWESKRELLSLLGRNHLLSVLSEYLYQHSMEVFTLVRSEETASAFSKELPYMLAYAVGGMHCMLLKWVEDGMHIPSSELIEKLKNGLMSPEI